MQTAPYDPKALYEKAQKYVGRLFDATESGDFEVAAVWSAISLELLAKWALATINPCLIAEPREGNSKHLLIAAGQSDDFRGFKTLQANQLFAICEIAFPPFSAKAAKQLAESRNAQIHSGMTPFVDEDQDQWWTVFWHQAAILLAAHETMLPHFAGSPERGEVAMDYIAKGKKAVQQLVEQANTKAIARIADSKWLEKQKEEAPEKPLAIKYFDFVSCPVCQQTAWIYGSHVLSSDFFVPNDVEGFFTPVQVMKVRTTSFWCPVCYLDYPHREYVEVAGLPVAFEIQTEIEFEEGEGWEVFGD